MDIVKTTIAFYIILFIFLYNTNWNVRNYDIIWEFNSLGEMMKEYEVTMDLFMIETVTVEANNKKDAFRKAKDKSYYNNGATEYKLFECVKIS